MFKYSLLLLCLLSTINSAYLPFKKNKEFPDDTCFYYSKGNYYVKDCGSGKYCNKYNGNVGICEKVPSEVVLSSLNGVCESDFECENQLICTNSQCSFGYDCSSVQTRVRTENGYICRDTQTLNIFYTKDFTWIEDSSSYSSPKGGYITGSTSMVSPDYLKVGGRITSWNITTDTLGKIYEPAEIRYSDIGTVDDGEFVFDTLACKSGFALYFYGDSKLNNPYNDNNNYNYMYKKCVTLEDIEYTSSPYCEIKYKLGDKSYTYNVNKFSSYAKTLSHQKNNYNDYYGNYRRYLDYFDSIDKYELCDENLKLKIEIFQKYLSSLTDEIRKCEKPENPLPSSLTLETCQNNQLRKLSYFYSNPDEYTLYDSDDDKWKKVVNYLVQSEFPTYQSSSLLNIKYFISFLFLISLI